MLSLRSVGIKASITIESLRLQKRPLAKRFYLGSIGLLLSTVVTRGGTGSCRNTFLLYSTIMLHPKASNAFVASATPTHLSTQTTSTCFADSTANAIEINNTDQIMPHSIGLGTYMIPRDRVNTTMRFAILNAGYRRIDCAPVYFNEDVIGDTIHDILNLVVENHSMDEETVHGNKMIDSPINRIQRSDLYLVSKLPSPFHRHVELAVRKTLHDLRVDYLDLYLVHWPVSFFPVPMDPSKRGWENEDIDDSNNGLNIDESVSIHDVWNGMEHAFRLGLVRAIGVSNMPLMLLHELLSRTTTPPSVLQIELHPYLQQTSLLRYCQRRKIHVQAYSPLGTPGYKELHEPNVLIDPTLQRIAKFHSISTAQLCIVWALQRGTSIVTKSLNEQHLVDNIQMLSPQGTPTITLTEQDMDDIAKLDRGYRFFRPQDWWGEKSMAVFD